MNIYKIFNSFISLIKTLDLAALIDILIVSFIIYSVIKLIRETRAQQLVKGILVLLIAYALSRQMNLVMLGTILNNFFQFSVLALLVVFQPELRRALEQIGRSNFGKHLSINNFKEGHSNYENQKRCIDAICESTKIFQQSKTGALIVFERQTRLGDIINTGTVLDAIPSVHLISNIFFNKSPLHDGAVIVRNSMIYAAGCILPLSKNANIRFNLGTRHRAALGMSENSDALVVVVSEETGNISVIKNGVLTRGYDQDTLSDELFKNILIDQSNTQTSMNYVSSIKKIFRGKKKD